MPASNYWLGPTYEFRAGDWVLLAGIPVEEGRLEWLLRDLSEDGEDNSHSFVLDPHPTAQDLESALADLPPEVVDELVHQVMKQTEPRLLSGEGEESGLA